MDEGAVRSREPFRFIKNSFFGKIRRQHPTTEDMKIEGIKEADFIEASLRSTKGNQMVSFCLRENQPS